jgi:hypothetical protein
MARKWFLVFASLLLVGGISVPYLFGQVSQKRNYATLEYMKVSPGKTTDYRRLERKIIKPAHQARVRLGKIDSWRLYSARFPTGTERECADVTMAVMSELGNLDQPYEGIDFQRVVPNMKGEEIVARTSSTRRIIRQDVYCVAEATEEWSMPGAKHLRIHFIKPLELQEATAAMEGLAEHVRVEFWNLVEQTDPR